MTTKRKPKSTKPDTKSIVHRAMVQYYVAKDHVEEHKREYTIGAASLAAGAALMAAVQEVL